MLLHNPEDINFSFWGTTTITVQEEKLPTT